MATTKTTNPTTPTAPATPKARKPAPSLVERTKAQLNAAALRGKLSVDDLADLEQAIKRLAVFLGSPA